MRPVTKSAPSAGPRGLEGSYPICGVGTSGRESLAYGLGFILAGMSISGDWLWHTALKPGLIPPFDARRRESGQIRATLLVRQERAKRVMVEIAAIASIRKARRMPQARF